VRKRIEEGFGWIKAAGGFRKTRHRGTARPSHYFCSLLDKLKVVSLGVV
jgi:hypothetical protein